MGDVAPWLTGLLVPAVGLVTWLVRWIVKREREIAANWRAVAETEQANTRTVIETQHVQNQALLRIEERQMRILALLGQSGSVDIGNGRHHAGSAGYEYGETRTPQPSRPWPP